MRQLFWILAAVAVSAHGGELAWKHADYDKAGAAATTFAFHGESTKLGVWTTTFEGRAREGLLAWREDQGLWHDVVLTMPVAGLDTDSDARDEKMGEHCLQASAHPTIVVRLAAPIDPRNPPAEIAATLSVRGRETSVPLRLSRREGTVEGEGRFKLSALGIPDPSIAVAKVRDEFTIRFKVALP
jgi:hypothetical protein